MGGLWFWMHNSVMSAVWPLVVIAQVACVIHVLRTGRPYWWIWIIFAIPLIGLGAYLYLEVRPSLGRHWFHNLLWKLKSSRERIGILESQLSESSTVRNRLTLAEELHDAAQYDRECDVLAEGLRGAFKDDATLMMRLAEAHLEAGRVEKANELLSQTAPEKSPESRLQYSVLSARIASRLAKPDAENQFQQLVSRRRSEGPRYYYAEHLLEQGRPGEAVQILKDILYQYRRGTVVWRFQEQKWYHLAKKLLRSSNAKNRRGTASHSSSPSR